MHLSKERASTLKWFFLGLLLAMGIILRFLSLRDMEFKGDEYAATILVYRNLFGPSWLSAGIGSSAGIPNPPFFTYLLSIPALVSLSPVALTCWIALLNAGGIVLLLLVLRRVFPARVALEVTALMASAPWAIVFSRKIWTQDILFPFVVLFLFLCVSLLQRERAWKIVLLCVTLALVIQLHMSAWFLPLPLVLFVMGNRPRLRWGTIWPFLLGLAVAFVIWLPYVLFLFHEQFAALRGLLTLRAGGSWDAHNVPWAFRITGTQGFEYLLGSGMDELSRNAAIGISQTVSAAYQVVTVVGFFFLLWHVAARTRWFFRIDRAEPWEKLLSLLFLIFIVIHACFALFHIPAYPHYNIIFYPFLPLLFVVFLRYVVEKWMPMFRSFNSLLIVAVILANLTFSTSFLLFIHRHPASIHGDYGVPYRLKEAGWRQSLQEELQRIRNR